MIIKDYFLSSPDLRNFFVKIPIFFQETFLITDKQIKNYAMLFDLLSSHYRIDKGPYKYYVNRFLDFF